MIRSDNGRDFIAGTQVAWLQEHRVEAAFVARASPSQNWYVERSNGTMRDELLDRETFNTIAEARVVIARYYAEYNHDRLHRGLKIATPLAFDRAERRRPREANTGANESRYHRFAWTGIAGVAATTRPSRFSHRLDQTQGPVTMQ